MLVKAVNLPVMTFTEHIALNILTIRTEKKISATQLAKTLGCTRQRIYQMESGVININAATIEAIAKALKVHPETLTHTGTLVGR